MSTNDGVQIFDSRPSDAIALAIRYDAPIYVSEHIMNKAGVNAPIDDHNQYTKIDHATLIQNRSLSLQYWRNAFKVPSKTKNLKKLP